MPARTLRPGIFFCLILDLKKAKVVGRKKGGHFMAITPKVFFDGAVQSLGFSDRGHETRVGVMILGKWDFGIATRKEKIRVLTGRLMFKGGVYYSQGPAIVINPGDSIVIEVPEETSYMCTFD